MNKRHLLTFAALLWGIPGVIISVKGISAYTQISSNELWYLLIITALVLCGFYFMFRKIVNKYSERILSLKGKINLLHTFPVKGWVLLVFMMSLGILLKNIPNIPLEFIASFYSGLGPMLVVSAVRFILYHKKIFY